MFVSRFLLFLFAGALCASDVNVVEQIVAKVNGDIITTGDLERDRQQLLAGLKQSGVSGQQFEQELKEREADLLRDRIDRLLLQQKAEELNINVDAEVTKYLADIQRDNKIADQDKFQEWIRVNAKMPFEDFKAEMKNTFLTRRVVSQEVHSRISIPRAEARKYYDEHKDEFIREERVFLREILVSTEGKSEAEIPALEKKAKDLVARARSGERFGDLARDNSDADSARNSGQVGAFKRADLAKEIADVVFNHEKNYVTDPIKVGNGFLILQIEERHQAGLAAFEEVENEVMEKLYMPRFDPAMRDYLTNLRLNAFLEIREGFVDSGAAAGKSTAWRDPAELKPETVTREEVMMTQRRRRLLWMIPVPGTSMSVVSSTDQ